MSPLTGDKPVDDLADLVAALGSDRFGPALMEVLRLRAGADLCSAFTVTDSRAAVLVAESADPGASAFARIASLRYAQRYWRRDVAALSTLGRAHRKVQVLRRPADGIRDLDYQHECYAEGAVIERLSLYRDGRPAIIANAYRARASGPFTPGHLAAFATAAPLLHALIARHAEAGATNAATGAPGIDGGAGLAAALSRDGRLSAREAKVAALILSGHQIAEIAEALGVACTTAITYRRRAYAKLGAASRAELRSRARALLDG